MGLILSLILNTLSLILAGYLVPGIHIQDLMTGVVLAVVFGVLNTFIKPVVKILTLPLTIVTLGLFLVVINVAFVYFASYLVPGFSIDSIWSALLFSIAVSLLNSFLSKFGD